MNCTSNNGDGRTSHSADINHLLYYYDKKKKNNISDINDDNRVSHSSCQEEYLHFLFSGDLFIFHGIFLEPLIC